MKKLKTKHIVVISVVAVAAIGLYAYNKLRQFKKVFDNMRATVTGVRNVKLTLTYLTFDLDITLHNRSEVPFSITGASIATLKRVVVYRNNMFLGQAEVNLEGLDIPAFGSVTVENLPFRLLLSTVADNFLSGDSLSMNNLTITAVVEVLGQPYEIES